MRTIILLLFFSLPLPSANAGWFGHDNYWECILDSMKDIQNDTIAQEAIDYCKDKFPFHERVFVDKKHPWFGVKTAKQCVLKYGKHVKSDLAARHIQAACYKLYLDKDD